VFPQGRRVTQYQFIDDVSVTKGNHSLKFGTNFRRNDVSDAIFGTYTHPRLRVFFPPLTLPTASLIRFVSVFRRDSSSPSLSGVQALWTGRVACHTELEAHALAAC